MMSWPHMNTGSAPWLRPALLGLCLAISPVHVVVGRDGLSLAVPAAQAATPVKGSLLYAKDGVDDDDDDDDDSGRGRGRGRGRGGDDDRDDDDLDDDDLDDDDDDMPTTTAGQGDPVPGSDEQSSRQGSSDVIRVEVLSNGVIVHFSDGSREQIIDGVYSRIRPNGSVQQSHRASGADIVRIRLLASGQGVRSTTATVAANDTAPAHPIRIRLGRRSVSVDYSNGWTEVVEDGQYRMVDRYGNTILSRPASQADFDRLRALAGR